MAERFLFSKKFKAGATIFDLAKQHRNEIAGEENVQPNVKFIRFVELVLNRNPN